MPSHARERCRQCGKLSLEKALQKHGSEGDGCWEGEPCHKRRTYYRHRERYNRSRRLKYKGEKETSAQLAGIQIPSIPAVVIHFYRKRKDDDLHALGAELWVGQQKQESLPPVHTLGWTEGDVKAYIRELVKEYARKYELQISGIAATVELDPCLCLLTPCPLKLVSDSGAGDGASDENTEASCTQFQNS